MAKQPSTANTGEKPAGEEKKSKALMIGLIAGGAALLLCCCTGVGGVGVWFFVLRNVNETLIVGTWREEMVTFEFRSDKKLKRNNFDLIYKFVDANTIEIKGDTVGNNLLNGQPYPTIRYRVEIRGETLTLTEVSQPPPGEQAEKYLLKKR